MNDDHLIERLASLGTTSYDTPHTKRAMRAALQRRFERRSWLSSLRASFVALTESPRLYAPVGAFLVLLIVASVSSTYPSASPQALALLDQSFARMNTLDVSERMAIEARLDGPLDSVFAEASRARDLVEIDEEAVLAYGIAPHPVGAPESLSFSSGGEVGDVMTLSSATLSDMPSDDARMSESAPMAKAAFVATAPANESDAMTFSATFAMPSEVTAQVVRYLSYTNPSGERVIIGIGEDGVALFRVRVRE